MMPPFTPENGFFVGRSPTTKPFLPDKFGMEGLLPCQRRSEADKLAWKLRGHAHPKWRTQPGSVSSTQSPHP
jgi:hypothetical protein